MYNSKRNVCTKKEIVQVISSQSIQYQKKLLLTNKISQTVIRKNYQTIIHDIRFVR